MGDTIKWAVAMWFKITLALAVGCGITRLLVGAGWVHPGWFYVAVIGSGCIEWFVIGGLARECSFEGRLRWWWPW